MHAYFLLVGLLLFVTGMRINVSHDKILISLKNESKDQEGTEYRIPRGGLFHYSSGANYLGEIVEWWGLALASRGLPQVALFLFLNLSSTSTGQKTGMLTAALSTHTRSAHQLVSGGQGPRWALKIEASTYDKIKKYILKKG